MESVTDTGAQGLAGAASEEAGDFARVAAMVADAEPGPVEAAQAEADAKAEAEKMDAAESLSGLLSVVSGVCAVAGFERTAAVWSPDVCGRVAAVTIPVLRKYPWGGRILEFLERGTGAEEVALGMVVLPLAVATAGAVRADMSAKDEKPGTDDAPKPTAATVVSMREVHGHADQ